MTIIKCLSEQIEDELNDAAKYADLALKWKEDDPSTADLFYELSKEEMGHMERLHGRVTGLIEEHRAKNGEPPQDMMTLYDYLHEKHKQAATGIKVKQAMYTMQE